MATKPGFCGRKRGAPSPNPPMTTDPNADLIGTTFPVDTGGVGTVIGTWQLGPAYVEVDTPAGLTLRVAAQVRRGRELA